MPKRSTSPRRHFRTLLCSSAIAAATLLSPALFAHPAGSLSLNGPPSSGDQAAAQPLLDIAEAFLASPDSGVWNGEADTFRNTAATFDHAGHLTARYQRYFHGVRVLRASVKVNVDPSTGEVVHNYPPTPFAPPAVLDPRLRESQVWDAVADHLRLDAEGFYGDIELAIEPQADAPATLVWRVHAFHPDSAPSKLYLDAHTGDVLWNEKGYVEDSVNAEGTGFARPYSGETQPREVELDTLLHDHDNRFFLVDHTRGGSKVMDMEDGAETVFFKGVDYGQADSNVWGDGLDWRPGDDTRGITGQTAAVEALWAAQRAWDMLLNTRNIEGYDGKAAPMLLRVHYRKKKNERYDDANWDGTYANFGDGVTDDEWSSTDPFTVSHELGHGVWHHHVADDNKGEARGLNEGHADITAALTVHYAQLADGLGSSIPTHERGNLGHFMKRMVNPWSYSADGETGLAGYVNGMEDREEHCQGTAYGHMFTILAMGIPSQAEADAAPCEEKLYTCLAKSPFHLGLAGIGLERAAFIWREATLKYFDEDPTFHEARDAYLQAAIDGFGFPSPEHSAVQNAFYLINVGDPAEDLGPPEIGPVPPIVDHAEGSVLIEAIAVDDIGVVQMSASTGGDWKKVSGDKFKGYLAISTIPGAKTATVKAIDGSLAWSEATIPFDYHSEDRLFLTGFETSTPIDGDWYSGGWQVSTEEMIVHDEPGAAFLGGGFIRFEDGRAMRKTFTVPNDATALQLGFRYRVDATKTHGGQLLVEIRDSQDNILESAPAIDAGDAGIRDFSNNYFKGLYPLSNPYAGQTLTLRFAADGSWEDAFRIDQVYMRYEAPETAVLDVDVDEREGSVIFDANFSGFSQSRIDVVKFFVDGVEISEDHYWPYQIIRSPDLFAKDTPLEAEAVAYDHFGDPIVSSQTVPFEVDSIDQLIFNGDFENGDAFWSLTGDVDLCSWNPASGQTLPTFMGFGCMAFEGQGTLSRHLWIPGNALTASLSFRMDNDSPPGSGETLWVRIIDNATDSPLTTVEITGTGANTDLGTSHMGFRKYVLDMTPYIGLGVRVEFESDHTGPPAHFTVDNVGARHDVFEGHGGPGGVTD